MENLSSLSQEWCFHSVFELEHHPFGFSSFTTLDNSFLAWGRSLIWARLMQMHYNSFVFPPSLRRWCAGSLSGAELTRLCLKKLCPASYVAASCVFFLNRRFLSFSSEKEVNVISMCRKCIFYFILNPLPHFVTIWQSSHWWQKTVCVAINIRIEEYIVTHSFASPWTLRKQNLIWQYLQPCLSKVLRLDNFGWDFYGGCWPGKRWCLVLAEQRVIRSYCEQSLCCTEDSLNKRLLTLIQIK